MYVWVVVLRASLADHRCPENGGAHRDGDVPKRRNGPAATMAGPFNYFTLKKSGRTKAGSSES
jgi:hypothetical protein